MKSKYSYVHIEYVNYETGVFHARYSMHEKHIVYNISMLEQHTQKRLAEGNVYRIERLSPRTNWMLIIYMGEDSKYERRNII
jgi:hypothetical protein